MTAGIAIEGSGVRLEGIHCDPERTRIEISTDPGGLMTVRCDGVSFVGRPDPGAEGGDV